MLSKDLFNLNFILLTDRHHFHLVFVGSITVFKFKILFSLDLTLVGVPWLMVMVTFTRPDIFLNTRFISILDVSADSVIKVDTSVISSLLSSNFGFTLFEMA